MLYFQEDLSPWTKAAFEAMFGPVHVTVDPDSEFEVYAFHGRWDQGMNATQAAVKAIECEMSASGKAAPDAAAACIIKVLDEQLRPVPDVSVVWYWPDARQDSTLGWDNRGDLATTNANGDAGMAMGGGAYYFAPNIGPHRAWIRGAGVSDRVEGLGMLGGTNHFHVDVWFKRRSDDAPPDDPGGDEPLTYYDASGRVKDPGWALTFFGVQDIHRAPFPKWQLVELHEATGDHKTLAVRFLNADGSPRPNVTVILGPRDVGGSVARAETNADGYATFGMQDAHRFYVPGQGHWVAGSDLHEGNSDFFNAVGWVGGSSPRRWLNPVFKYATEDVPVEPPPDEPPPDEPPGDDWKVEAYAHLDALRALIEAA